MIRARRMSLLLRMHAHHRSSAQHGGQQRRSSGWARARRGMLRGQRAAVAAAWAQAQLGSHQQQPASLSRDRGASRCEAARLCAYQPGGGMGQRQHAGSRCGRSQPAAVGRLCSVDERAATQIHHPSIFSPPGSCGSSTPRHARRTPPDRPAACSPLATPASSQPADPHPEALRDVPRVQADQVGQPHLRRTPVAQGRQGEVRARGSSSHQAAHLHGSAAGRRRAAHAAWRGGDLASAQLSSSPPLNLHMPSTPLTRSAALAITTHPQDHPRVPDRGAEDREEGAQAAARQVNPSIANCFPHQSDDTQDKTRPSHVTTPLC